MTEILARGACPRLATPMETGDGLLARIVPTAPIEIDDFAALCAAAQTYGNGLMEVSARGSLQVRGLTDESSLLFAEAATHLGLAAGEGTPVLATPLPDDPGALINAQTLAENIRMAIAARDLSLAPKVSVIIDGGGAIHLDGLSGDVSLRAVASSNAPKLLVSLAGDAASATPLGLAPLRDAPAVATDLLAVIAARGITARARDVLDGEGLQVFAGACASLDPPVAAPPRGAAQTIGLHGLRGGRCAIGIALPFGQAHALDLIALVRIARANGAAWVATAPSRTLLFGPIGEMTGFVLATAADTLGFVVDSRDSRRRVVACSGVPACTSGFIPARKLAAEIAEGLPASEEGIAAHVSGCAKGCAHPTQAPLTVIGTEQGYGFVQNGTARSEPEGYAEPRELLRKALLVKERTDA